MPTNSRYEFALKSWSFNLPIQNDRSHADVEINMDATGGCVYLIYSVLTSTPVSLQQWQAQLNSKTTSACSFTSGLEFWLFLLALYGQEFDPVILTRVSEQWSSSEVYRDLLFILPSWWKNACMPFLACCLPSLSPCRKSNGFLWKVPNHL